MDADALRDALEEAGLTGYQADAYITLLAQGMAPAVEIANQSSVPVSQIYDVLRTLEQRDYIETFEQDTLHARPKEPVTVLRDLRSRGRLMDDAADEIEDRWQQPALSEHKVSVVKHEDTVVDRARKAIREAENSIALSATVDQFKALSTALREAHDRDVIIRAAVYPDEDLEDGLAGMDLSETVTELRVCQIPGPLLVISDRTSTCFTPNDWANRPFGVLIEDYILSFIFHWYFQTCLWALWDPLYADDELPIPYVTIEEFVRDVVPMWQDGAEIGVTVYGTRVDSGETCLIEGTVETLEYTDAHANSGRPSYEQLAGKAAMRLRASDGERYSVGGWGAVFEDVEAVRIDLESVSFGSVFDGSAGAETEFSAEAGDDG